MGSSDFSWKLADHPKLPKGKTVAVVVLDGWGEANPDKYNCIHVAETPTMDSLKNVYFWFWFMLIIIIFLNTTIVLVIWVFISWLFFGLDPFSILSGNLLNFGGIVISCVSQLELSFEFKVN